MFVNIKLKRGAQMPRKAHNTDAAFDLYAHWIEYQEGMMVIGTGVHIEVPNGHVGLVFPRSSITNTIHRMANCVGVIDPGYTGEILAKYDSTWNTDAKRYEIGDRCAQILFLKTLDVQFAEVEELAETNRGDCGYGSTDAFNTITFNGLEYKEVRSKTGRIWLDRNLGAKRVAESPDDSESFGDYYTFDDIKCPKGYRLPTGEEWEAELKSWESKNSKGAFNSPLKLPVSGYRNFSSGNPFNVGSFGFYWSSSVSRSFARFLYFFGNYAGLGSHYRACWYVLRLIKE